VTPMTSAASYTETLLPDVRLSPTPAY
jgi:hypothetical protein